MKPARHRISRFSSLLAVLALSSCAGVPVSVGFYVGTKDGRTAGLTVGVHRPAEEPPLPQPASTRPPGKNPVLPPPL